MQNEKTPANGVTRAMIDAAYRVLPPDAQMGVGEMERVLNAALAASPTATRGVFTDNDHLRIAREAYFAAGGQEGDQRRAQKVSRIQIAIRDGKDGVLAPAPESARGEAVAWRDVLAERRRQIVAEGWTPEHDDGHAQGEMADAAALYASLRVRHIAGFATWPWSPDWFKPKDRRRDLVKAGALILAEIERLDRKDAKQ
jgi:hypothetical protein